MSSLPSSLIEPDVSSTSMTFAGLRSWRHERRMRSRTCGSGSPSTRFGSGRIGPVLRVDRRRRLLVGVTRPEALRGRLGRRDLVLEELAEDARGVLLLS